MAGAGHSTATAISAARLASPHPASRSGTADTGAGTDTGSMNARSSAVAAPASVELSTPEKSTANPTAAIAVAASHGSREAAVATQIKMAPAMASDACACSRCDIGPLKSTSSSIAKEPNAANVATSALPMTLSPSANRAGMTIAVLQARRRAA